MQYFKIEKRMRVLYFFKFYKKRKKKESETRKKIIFKCFCGPYCCNGGCAGCPHNNGLLLCKHVILRTIFLVLFYCCVYVCINYLAHLLPLSLFCLYYCTDLESMSHSFI